MQHGEVVGIGAQRVRQAILGFDLRRQYGPGIDSAGLGEQQPPAASEDRAELALADDGHLPDPLELVFVEPQPDSVGDLGQHAHQMRREERGLGAGGNPKRRIVGQLVGPTIPSVRPSDSRCRLRDQLVHRDPDHERQPQPFPRFTPDPFGNIDRRAEEPLSAGEVEKGMSVPAWLDDRCVDSKNLSQRARGAGIEPGIGRQQQQVGTELPGLPHQHAPRDSRGLRLGGEREHRRAIRSGRCDGDRPAPQRRRHQLLDGGAEGGGVNKKNGLHGRPIASLSGNPNASFSERSRRLSARSYSFPALILAP